jgi:hypothetical protein
MTVEAPDAMSEARERVLAIEAEHAAQTTRKGQFEQSHAEQEQRLTTLQDEKAVWLQKSARGKDVDAELAGVRGEIILSQQELADTGEKIRMVGEIIAQTEHEWRNAISAEKHTRASQLQEEAAERLVAVKETTLSAMDELEAISKLYNESYALQSNGRDPVYPRADMMQVVNFVRQRLFEMQ